MRTTARTGYILATIGAVVWAATSPGLSYLIEVHHAPALVLAFWRDAFMAIACLTGLGLSALTGRYKLPRLSLRDLRGFALMGMISVGIYHALFVYSIALNGAALAIVLIYLYPAFVTLGARLLFKEQISGMQIIALLLAIGGCILLVRAYDPAVLQMSWPGVLVGIGSAVTHAGYVLFNQRAVSRHSPWISLALTMSFGTLTLLGLNAVVLGLPSLSHVGTGALPWLVLLGLALGPTLIGYALFTISLRHISGQTASVIMVIEAPIATLAAVLLLGERINTLQSLGILAIIAAAALPGLNLRLPGRQPVPAGTSD